MIAPGTKVYFAVKPADLRRTFSLAALASAELAKDPTQGGLFIFLNRKGDQVRVTSKKRDDLQAVIAALKDADLGIPLQFENFRD